MDYAEIKSNQDAICFRVSISQSERSMFFLMSRPSAENNTLKTAERDKGVWFVSPCPTYSTDSGP